MCKCVWVAAGNRYSSQLISALKVSRQVQLVAREEKKAVAHFRLSLIYCPEFVPRSHCCKQSLFVLFTDIVSTYLSDDPQTPALDGIMPGMCLLPGFLEEVVVFFPLIQHGPNRKQRLQQLAAGTCLPSRCLATIGGFTSRPTDSTLIRHGPYRKRRVQQFIHCCVYSLPQENIPRFVKSCSGIQKLIWGIHRHTNSMEIA
jgi:hypothetical protein